MLLRLSSPGGLRSNFSLIIRLIRRYRGPCIFLRCASRLVYSEYGVPSEVVRHEDYEEERIDKKPTSVSVKMLLSPVNPADMNVIQGAYPIKPPLPAIGGGEGLGEVINVGSRVSLFGIGDWVLPSKPMFGTWRTEIVSDEEDFIKIRNDIDPVAAATLAVNPCTAYRMLRDFIELSPGDVVIQNGANSSVGQALIQIAKGMGLISINVVRDRKNIDELKEELFGLGGNYVLTEGELRKSTLFREEKISKPRIAFNCIGGQSSTEICRVLSEKGVHVTYGGMSLKPVTCSTSTLIFKDITFKGFWMTRWIQNSENKKPRVEMIEDLAEMVFQKNLIPSKHNILPLKHYKKAMESALRGNKTGKFILDMNNF